MAKHIKHPPTKGGAKIKTPVFGGVTSRDSESPIFCLRHLAAGWGVSDCERDDRAAFASTLEKLSKLTWQEIKGAPRHGVGTEKIAADSINAGIPISITEDVQFLAFRFNGKKSMVGFRGAASAVFHIVWIDHDFTLYKH